MLPDARNPPGQFGEPLVRVPIASRIPIKFPSPPVRVGARQDAVVGAAMPEASINEDDKPLPCEGDVHAAPRETLNAILDPESATPTVQFLTQQYLRHGSLPSLRGEASAQRRIGRHAAGFRRQFQMRSNA